MRPQRAHLALDRVALPRSMRVMRAARRGRRATPPGTMRSIRKRWPKTVASSAQPVLLQARELREAEGERRRRCRARRGRRGDWRRARARAAARAATRARGGGVDAGSALRAPCSRPRRRRPSNRPRRGRRADAPSASVSSRSASRCPCACSRGALRGAAPSRRRPRSGSVPAR